MWPTPTRPYLGVFTKRQVAGLRAAGANVSVMQIDGERRIEYLRVAKQVFALNRGPRRYGLIHAHTGHCGVLACLQFRYPVVMSYVGYDLDVHLGDAETMRTTVERFVFRWLSAFLGGTIAKSARGATHLPALGRRRNTVVPNGVDREQFRPHTRASARAALNWTHDDPVVLFAADPARWEKRFELCEAAVAEARRAIPGLRLEVASNVSPDHMPLWYSAADVLLLTSTQDHSPNVVKEALACNLPVVTVDVGDVPEVLDGSSLCHICAADSGALAEALIDVVRHLPERSDGRARTEWLAIPVITGRLFDVYARVVERGPGILGFIPRRRRR